jgi:hypothetical protein
MYKKFWSENLSGIDHSEHLGIDERIILEMDHREIGWEDEEWMHLAQERVQWQDLVNTVMNPWVT